MSNLQTNSQTLPGVNPSIRELSTAQRKDWIERIFTRLSGIYGSEFTYKWADVDSDLMKAEWADALGGFHADDISSALQSCRSQPKAPNLPEFASLCRQNMNTRTTVNIPPLSPEDREAAAKVARTVSDAMSAKKANTNGYMVNGVLVTVCKQWAVDLMKRESGGESLPETSKQSWREVLGYATDVDAKEVWNSIKGQRDAA